MKIKFEDMSLDGNDVKIKGKCKDRECYIKMSILQLAKLWNTDQEVFEKREAMVLGLLRWKKNAIKLES